MASIRQLIASAVRLALDGGKALQARELVPIVRRSLHRDDIDKTDVNSVLYRDMVGEVSCDARFAWQLINDSSKAGPKEISTTGDCQTASSLRTVQRLRSGLPPYEGIDMLTVGTRFTPLVKKLLSPGTDGDSWAIVRGQYGAGKSHALALFNDVALNEGYAVCHLSADGLNNALNHPQRFLPSLLSTLEVPVKRVFGYNDILHDLLMDPFLAGRASDIVSSHLPGGSMMATETRALLDVIADTDRSEIQSDLVRLSVRGAAAHLTGDTIRHSSASPSNRNTAYALLMIARDLAIELGLKGLALSIDEVESIYTKLPTSRSRTGAFRVLSGLCNLPKVKVVLAITPDAYAQLQDDTLMMQYDSPWCVNLETIREWSIMLREEKVPIFNCAPLRAADHAELLDRLSNLYQIAYGSNFREGQFLSSWKGVLGRAHNSAIPTRLLVRQAIDLMDSHRYC